LACTSASLQHLTLATLLRLNRGHSWETRRNERILTRLFPRTTSTASFLFLCSRITMRARQSFTGDVLVLLLLAVAGVARAEVGECRYDPDRCSCKIGQENQGVCWDQIAGSPGRCKRRFCSRGWTCSCGDRTHVCYRSDRQALKVADVDKMAAEADCTETAVQVSSSREISLGNLTIGVSPKGVAANK
jgi:hypothetical protein